MLKGQTNGWKSSELWITCFGLLAGVLAGLFSDATWAQALGSLAAGICPAVYANSRAQIKRALLAKQAAAEVSAMGKPASSESV